MVDRDCASPRSMDGTASADRIVGEHATQGGYEGGVIVDLNVSRSVILEATPRPSSVRQPRHDGTGGHVQLSRENGQTSSRMRVACDRSQLSRHRPRVLAGMFPRPRVSGASRPRVLRRAPPWPSIFAPVLTREHAHDDDEAGEREEHDNAQRQPGVAPPGHDRTIRRVDAVRVGRAKRSSGLQGSGCRPLSENPCLAH
jgi:hypothetical protein